MHHNISALPTCRNSNARYAGTTATGDGGLLSGTSRNGGISMACVVWASQTPKISMRLHLSRYVLTLSKSSWLLGSGVVVSSLYNLSRIE